jgi:hypothetical protein
MRMKTTLAQFFVWSSLSLASLGCATTTPTHVARGELFATGVAEYDELFVAVHALHEDAQRARFEAEGARAELVRALDVPNKADAYATVAMAKERAERLRDKKLLLHVQLTPEPKLIASLGGQTLETEIDALFKAIEGAVRSSLEVSSRLGALSDRASELETKRMELFLRGPTALAELPKVKRDEIQTELAAAKQLLQDDGRELAISAGDASRFVVALARALETGGAVAQPSAPEPAKPARSKPRRNAPPRSQAPAAKPAPKKPASGDDFEP